MLLALDTATKITGIALHDGARVLAEHIWQGGGNQTTQLASEVAMLMSRCSVSSSELTAIAVANGPGSYNGLRIGLALAKGLALGCGLPMVGILTLDILAHAQPAMQQKMLVLIRAGRGRWVGGWYKNRKGVWNADGHAMNLTWPEILDKLKQPAYVCGELEAEQREALRKDLPVSLATPAQCVRRPAVLAEIAWQRLHQRKASRADEVVPVYLGSLSGK